MHVYASSVVGRWVDVVIQVNHFLRSRVNFTKWPVFTQG